MNKYYYYEVHFSVISCIGRVTYLPWIIEDKHESKISIAEIRMLN